MHVMSHVERYTVISRLTSDPANEFSANEFFRCFWTRLTNMDSANECFSGCARYHKAANMNGQAIPREKFNQLWTLFYFYVL